MHGDITKIQADIIVENLGASFQKRGGIYGTIFKKSRLRSCYTKVLDQALKNGCESIAFPLVTGAVSGVSKDKALNIATKAIGQWLLKNDMEISLVIPDKTDFSLPHYLFGRVRGYVDRHYKDASIDTVPERDTVARRIDSFECEMRPMGREHRAYSEELKRKKFLPQESLPGFNTPPTSFTAHLDESFSTTLLRLIDSKGKTDVEVYKRANLDRKLFSKIRNDNGYMPSKKTAVAFAIALELSLRETNDLLKRAGFTLSKSVMFDVIIEYFISHRQYDIFEINNVLFEYDQPILGG